MSIKLKLFTLCVAVMVVGIVIIEVNREKKTDHKLIDTLFINETDKTDLNNHIEVDRQVQQSLLDAPGDTITYPTPINIITISGMRYLIVASRAGLQLRNLTLDSLQRIQ